MCKFNYRKNSSGNFPSNDRHDDIAPKNLSDEHIKNKPDEVFTPNNLFERLANEKLEFNKLNSTKKINIVERNNLDTIKFSQPDILRTINQYQFIKINGNYFSKSENQTNATLGFNNQHSTSLYASRIPILYAITSNKWHKGIYVGTDKDKLNALNSIFESIVNPEFIEKGHRPALELPVYGALTGIPTSTKKQTKNLLLHGIDLLINAFNKKNWAYIVLCFPLEFELVDKYFHQSAEELKQITSTIHSVDSKQKEWIKYHYMKCIENLVKRTRKGRSEGMWETVVYFTGDDENVVKNGLSLLQSIFTSEQFVPDPLRCHLCSDQAGLNNSDSPPDKTLLTSKEISSFICLPQKEYLGFALKEWVDFDVDFIGTKDQSISIGPIISYGVKTDQPISIPLKDLTKHGLVSGTTGSGKSNTLFYILSQIWEKYHIAFLVIEPTKSEYRNLFHLFREDFQIFTLGDETPGRSLPFRLNPFEFPKGSSLLTHIDYLKALFNAAFVMYGAMPHILEECLYEIYKDKGWLIVSSINERGQGNGAFPTLTDLYNKIDSVVERIGYEENLTMNFKSALKTRINNLRIGGKGKMLDTQQSIPFSEIMKKPTVLELKYMGSDDEKTFVMGLILIKLYQHYESNRAFQKTDTMLNHVTLIEEAHRLLKNVPTEKAGEEQSNMKGIAIEFFCNLLSEIRAYKEGILVAEQIPTKLAPDIMKNTNMKIMHRMVSKEERNSLGQTMNLSKQQMSYASTLVQGESIFFREGLDRPVLIQVPKASVNTGDFLDSAEIYRHMKKNFFSNFQSYLNRTPKCISCKLLSGNQCESVTNTIDSFLHFPNVEIEVVKSILRWMFNNAEELSQVIPNHLVEIDDEYTRQCLASHLLSKYINDRGSYYRWSFEEIDRIQNAVSINEKETFKKEIFQRKHVDFRTPECKRLCSNICPYGYEMHVCFQYFRQQQDQCENMDEAMIQSNLLKLIDLRDNDVLNIMTNCILFHQQDG